MNRPNLKNEILQNLYQYDFNLPKEVLKEILNLPKANLIADLKVVIEDAIANYKFYKTEQQQKEKDASEALAPVHAIFLLGELGAIEALPLVDKFLMQSEERLEFWLGNLITEDLWETIYKIAKSDITQLFTLVKEPNIYVFAKSSHKAALMKYLRLHTDEMDELVPKYKELLKFMIKRGKVINPEENWGSAAEDVSLFALDIVGNRLTVFESELKEIVDSYLFEEYYPEDWYAVKQRLDAPIEYEISVLTMVGRYEKKSSDLGWL